MEIADYITFGDINCDDKVDSADAILVLREYAMSLTGESLLSTAEKAAADVNGDGEVDANDAILMLQYYSKSLGGEAPRLAGASASHSACKIIPCTTTKRACSAVEHALFLRISDYGIYHFVQNNMLNLVHYYN